MSKLALFVAVPALVGVGVLTVVNLELASDLRTTETRVAELEDALAAVPERAPEPASRTGERREEARLRALEDRLASLETRGMEPATALAAGDTDDVAAAPATLVAGGTEIERAVTQVLDARDAERRLERREQMVERGAERLLRDVEVSDAQRAQVRSLFADYVRRTSEMRDQDLGPELTGERAVELREELRRGLEGVLDATQMETVGARLGRRVGGDAATRDGARRPDRRGGRRGGGRQGAGDDS